MPLPKIHAGWSSSGTILLRSQSRLSTMRISGCGSLTLMFQFLLAGLSYGSSLITILAWIFLIDARRLMWVWSRLILGKSMRIPCPKCGHLNPIDKEVIFESVFEWFICGNCADVYVKSRYGEWLESNPYQEYVRTLILKLDGWSNRAFLQKRIRMQMQVRRRQHFGGVGIEVGDGSVDVRQANDSNVGHALQKSKSSRQFEWNQLAPDRRSGGY